MSSYHLNIKGPMGLSDYSSVDDYINILDSKDEVIIEMNCEKRQNVDIICNMLERSNFEINKKDSATIIIKLSTEIEGLSIHYSFDNSFPDNYYPAYSSPLIVPKDASAMKVITYRDNKPIGRLIVMPVAEMRKRAGIK